MIFGIALFLIGYTIWYWGWSHFPNQTHYSLWQLFGFSTITSKGQKTPGFMQGNPFQQGSSVQYGTKG